jgi:hypothetical protein
VAAVRRYRQALELIAEAGDRYPEVEILIGLAAATGGLGTARHALTLAERAGYLALRGEALTVIADILVALGRPEEAAEHAGHALAVHRETGHHLGELLTATILGQTGTPAAG